MAYSRKTWVKVTNDTFDLINAANREDWKDVEVIAKRLLAYKRSNPDWIGTALSLSGAFLTRLPNPAAVLIGSTLLGASRLRMNARTIKAAIASIGRE